MSYCVHNATHAGLACTTGLLLCSHRAVIVVELKSQVNLEPGRSVLCVCISEYCTESVSVSYKQSGDAIYIYERRGSEWFLQTGQGLTVQCPLSMTGLDTANANSVCCMGEHGSTMR